VNQPVTASPMPALSADERESRLRAIHASPTYRLAEDDVGFMESEAARASRLALEFMRVDTYLREHRVRSTVVVFGGARIVAPDAARAALLELEGRVRTAAGTGDASAAVRLAPELAQARTALDYSRFYEEARVLGAELARHSAQPAGHEFVVATGGGPGIMEGANRGAFECGAPTIGFNIRLPQDQPPNPYVTPTLAFRFHYFALRKMHFLLRARALVAFPGGFGTLDEVFESLNLVQTQVIAPIPIVLVGREHWRRVIDLDFLIAKWLIREQDRDLVCLVDTGLEAAAHIRRFHGLS
jgi:uncharacterized protein (TIGR00730 family)